MTAVALSGCSAGAVAPAALRKAAASAQMSVEAATRTPLRCTMSSQHTVQGAPVVPVGAVAARLCGGQVDNAGFDLVWPADTLYGRDVSRLVGRLNRLEPYVQPTSCTLPLSPGFDLVLMYPNGSRVRVHGDTAGTCEHLTVHGGFEWRGAPGVLRETLNLIESRRRSDGPAVRSVDLACPRRWNDVSFTAGATPVQPHTRGVTAVACRYRLHLDPRYITQSADGRLVGQTRVHDMARLVREVGQGSRVDPCSGMDYDLDRTQDVILIQDRYGDIQVVSMSPCWPNELTGQRLYPSHSLAEQTARLLS